LALDVWIGDWNDRESRLLVSFEPETYYCFVVPSIEETYAMHHRLLLAWTFHLALAMAPVFAEEPDQSNPLPDPELLASAIVIDCGQWPIELDEQLATQFRSNCQKNSKLMGYSQAWTLTQENVPQAVFDNPSSFSCKVVAKENTGYYCVGIRNP
jgi:hypothetical protein